MAPKSKPKNNDAFSSFTIQVDVEGKWQKTVLTVLKNYKEVKQCKMEGNGMVTISGEVDPHKVLKCLAKLGKSAKLVRWQYGECSTNLVEKKKEEAPKNNNNNNQDKGPIYPCYGGYNNYGYGGYNTYGYGYGYGYDYNYDFNYPTFGSNLGYYNNNHLECGGHAADCNSYHMQKPDNSTPSSTEKPADKPSSSSTKPEKLSSVSFKKLGVHGHKGCSLM